MSGKHSKPEIATPLCDDTAMSTSDFAVTVGVEAKATTAVVNSLAIEAARAPGHGSDAAGSTKTWLHNKGCSCGWTRVAMLTFIFVMLCAVAVLLITEYALSSRSSPADEATEDLRDSAFLTLQHQMEQMEDGFDADDREAFDAAFDTFDIDHDDVLNEAEFSGFFARELSYSAEFERMDVDGDGVLSYPESVAYVQRMGEIEALKQYLIDSLSNLIAAQFSFAMTAAVDAADDTDEEYEESLALFLEYVAVVAYFGTYDTDLNGYVRHDEFTAISAQNEFGAYADSVEGVGREAFFDILYGDGEFSWTGALQKITCGQSEETVSAWAAVEISADTVRQLEVKLNPMQLLRDAEAEAEQQSEGSAGTEVAAAQIQFIFVAVHPMGFRRRLCRRCDARSIGFPKFAANEPSVGC